MKTLCALLLLVSLTSVYAAPLKLVRDEGAETISVFRPDGEEAILVQNARSDHRPYLHPIVAPDGKGILTEYSPGHHPHQTGLYWGMTRVNGRDYFHNPSNGYWCLGTARTSTSTEVG